MKLMVACAVLAVAVAAPPVANEDVAQVLPSQFDQNPEGGYEFGFETSNGIARQEIGELKEVLDKENKRKSVLFASGSYVYTDPHGKLQTIRYHVGWSQP